MKNKLFHCFGGARSHIVDTQLAAEMLRASGCKDLAINTHNLDTITRGEDLPVGYGSATLGSVTAAVHGLDPVLNINHAQTVEEAVHRARGSSKLTGLKRIKLEVLTPDLVWTANEPVLEAAQMLLDDGYEVWPLLTPDLGAYDRAVKMGCSMVRVMGSGIGTRKGIEAHFVAPIREILKQKRVPVMLDGGIGTVKEGADAMAMGFDCILVNSCLFHAPNHPVKMLRDFREAVSPSAHGSQRQIKVQPRNEV